MESAEEYLSMQTSADVTARHLQVLTGTVHVAGTEFHKNRMRNVEARIKIRSHPP